MACNTKISPTYFVHDFSRPTLDDKITIFEDRVLGWQMEIAQQLVDKVPHSGFGVLSILASYFEMISRFREGSCSTAKPDKFFRLGIRSVFSNLSCDDDTLKILWEDLRSGPYHYGVTGPRVRLSASYPPLDFAKPGDPNLVKVNPHALPRVLTEHLKEYVARLRNPVEAQLRAKFEARFDWQGNPQRRSTRQP